MSDQRVLLIGLDGADWHLIQPLMDAGKMPALLSLVEGGVSGRIASLFPAISPILWNSIATGKRAGKHGILGFTEVDPLTQAIRPVTSNSRKCKAIWNILHEKGKHASVVNWFASHPAESLNGVAVSNLFAENFPPSVDEAWPLAPGTVFPPTLAETLSEARIHPQEIERETVQLFVPNLAEAQENDMELLRRLVCEIAKAYSINTATTWILESQPWQFVATYFRLIDLVGHHFMPFAPPQLPSTDDRQFKLFSEVVNHAYQFFDLLLTSILARAGDDATVILLSDHGFHSGETRPQPTEDSALNPEAWHRDHGIFVMRGPGIRTDELLHGAGLLDVAPTILSIFGLPVARDMDGRVLVEAFEEPIKIRPIETWEEERSEDPSADVQMSGQDAAALIEQFVALGYVTPPQADSTKAADDTRRQNQWNLARDYMDAADFESALPILEALDAVDRHAPDLTFQLALCQWRLGLNSEAELTLQHLMRFTGEGPQMWFLQGVLALESGDSESAVALLEKTFENMQGGWIRGFGWALGRAYLLLGQWNKAEGAFRLTIEHEPDNGFAYQGLARVLLKQGRNEEAAEAAMDALALHHNLPWAHLFLGQALKRMRLFEQAEQALRVAISYRREFPEAFRELGDLLEQLPDRQAEANDFRQKARACEDSDVHTVLMTERRQAAQARSIERWDDLWNQPQPLQDDSSEQTLDSGSYGSVGDVIVVSGLPRSGTSMMMQMLEAGGVPILTDGNRPADDFNAQGYYEWEPAKELSRHPERIAEANGKAVKLISVLLPLLPPTGNYKIIFMERPIVEVVNSQQAMLKNGARPKGPDPFVGSSHMSDLMARHREEALCLLSDHSDRFQVLKVPFHSVLADPHAWAEKICGFLDRKECNIGAMASVVRPDLHHPEFSEIE